MKALTFLLLAMAVPLSGVELHISPQGKPTLQEAIRAARNRPAGEPCNIWLRGGTYELTEPLMLEKPDSGLAIAAEENEKPILSGGKRITGWKEVDGVWETKVENWNFRSLFVNGQRATLARTPNAGSFFRMRGERLGDKPPQFKFAPGEIKSHWLQEPDATIVAFEKWTDFR